MLLRKVWASFANFWQKSSTCFTALRKAEDKKLEWGDTPPTIKDHLCEDFLLYCQFYYLPILIANGKTKCVTIEMPPDSGKIATLHQYVLLRYCHGLLQSCKICPRRNKIFLPQIYLLPISDFAKAWLLTRWPGPAARKIGPKIWTGEMIRKGGRKETSQDMALPRF